MSSVRGVEMKIYRLCGWEVVHDPHQPQIAYAEGAMMPREKDNSYPTYEQLAHCSGRYPAHEGIHSRSLARPPIGPFLKVLT